jgi:hypothetical protein
MEKLTAEIVRSLVKELKATVPDVRIKAHYCLDADRTRELIRRRIGLKRTIYSYENPCTIIVHNPQNIVEQIPVVATLDFLEVWYGKPEADFVISLGGEAILYNTNKYTDEVIKILEKYKIRYKRIK